MSKHFPRIGDHVGMLSGIHVAVQFVRWADRLHKPPTWQAIAARWGVHRSTAYRWRRAYLDETQAYRMTEGAK